MRTELDNAYLLLAKRMAGEGIAPTQRAPAATPLARSVMSVRDTTELNKK